MGLNVYKLIFYMKLKFYNNKIRSLLSSLYLGKDPPTVITIMETTYPYCLLNFFLAFYFYGSKYFIRSCGISLNPKGLQTYSCFLWRLYHLIMKNEPNYLSITAFTCVHGYFVLQSNYCIAGIILKYQAVRLSILLAKSWLISPCFLPSKIIYISGWAAATVPAYLNQQQTSVFTLEII